ncbi:MAG: LPXTG cell wall anchor domain-containing protein [Microbacteriaceae bacterium]|nr:LPXTG cell wall anchor domain-containing protein [Microbacteriaceae bacterium]MCI1207079.1 LPXTG cell wall anchor domain-containing protein [Microbacteriaceae bacterium]
MAAGDTNGTLPRTGETLQGIVLAFLLSMAGGLLLILGRLRVRRQK